MYWLSLSISASRKYLPKGVSATQRKESCSSILVVAYVVSDTTTYLP